ncbi:MAG: hypothetical protein HUK08_03490 [Bacteroidaceae bacterium]|nr:hypothetical protein [Bacteroidaceae bacterium]
MSEELKESIDLLRTVFDTVNDTAKRMTTGNIAHCRASIQMYSEAGAQMIEELRLVVEKMAKELDSLKK